MTAPDRDTYAEVAWEAAGGASCDFGGTDYRDAECGQMIDDLVDNEFGYGWDD